MSGERGGEGIGRGGEGDLELVADDEEDIAVVGGDGVVEEGVMAGEGAGHGIGVLARQLGAALNIRKQERHRAARWNRHV